MAALSPMMQQYFDIKKQHPDKILFFRLGDFYEMFYDDAILASKELVLTLTGRDCGQEERAPMCGVPFHSYENYVARLIARLPFSTLFIVSSDMSALSASSACVIPSLLRSFLIFPAIISYICSLFPIIPSSFLTLPHYIRNYYGVWQSVTICHFRIILCRFLSIPF